MLYAYYGTDIRTAGEKARVLVNNLRKKKPDASFVKIDSDNWSVATVQNHLGGQGLFSSKYIVFIDRVIDSLDEKADYVDLFQAISESENIFILLEAKIGAEIKKKLDKYAEKVVVCDEKDVIKSRTEFNVFSIAESVYRDQIRAWSNYRKAIDLGIEPESLVGILFWKAKSVGDKRLAGELVTLYHDSHRGILDMEIGLEKIILNCRKT